MRVTFDANAIDAWERLGPAQREALSASFRAGNYEPLCTPEFLEECLAIGGTEKAARLPAIAGWLLELTSFDTFRYHGDIIQSELQGQRDLHLRGSILESIQRLLREIASGSIPTDLADLTSASRQRKSEAAEFHRQQQKLFRERLHKFPKGVAHISFDDFRQKYWTPSEKQLTADILMRLGTAHPESRAAEILSRISEYPYLGAYLRTHAALTFRYYARDRKIRDGDLYDASQIVYLVGCKLIVSDDSGLRETCDLVWGSSRRAKTFAEFMNGVQSDSQSA